MFKQNLNPAIFSLKVRNPTKNVDDSLVSILHSLSLNHAFSLGHGSIRVLPTPDNMAQQRNKGMARNHTKSFEPCKAFDDYLTKEGCLEDPFSKQILRNYQPCVSTPRTLEQRKECVNQQNTVYHKCCPQFLSYNLGGRSHEQP